MAEEDKLVQSALKRYEAAQTRSDELMPIAHTKTSGVRAELEADDPALRAQRREAKAARNEAWRDLKELIQKLYPQKE